jgi:hypothetical protein
MFVVPGVNPGSSKTMVNVKACSRNTQQNSHNKDDDYFGGIVHRYSFIQLMTISSLDVEVGTGDQAAEEIS